MIYNAENVGLRYIFVECFGQVIFPKLELKKEGSRFPYNLQPSEVLRPSVVSWRFERSENRQLTKVTLTPFVSVCTGQLHRNLPNQMRN
jgi:hypothetical protein